MRTIVVTGSASGIGQATAELLAARGDRVIGVDLQNADVNVDLTSPDGRSALIEQVRELSGGQIDGIIANAGLAAPIPATVAVNVGGAIATLEGLRPLLANSPAPRAALTSSMASLQPADDTLVDLALTDEAAALARAEELIATGGELLIYSSSKHAITKWMRSVAAGPQWAGAGIPLNAIGPAVVATNMTADMIATDEATDELLKLVPMPLNGVMGPEVPANVLAMLVSEQNTHLCGQLIFVDGGYDVVTRGASTW